MRTPTGDADLFERNNPSGSPEVLCLRPGATVLDTCAEQLQVTFPNYTATFFSPPVTRGIREILAALTTGRPRAEVVKVASLASAHEPAFIEYLIDVLLANKCLYRGSQAGPSPPESHSLAEFFAYVGDDPGAVLALLANARPLLVVPSFHGKRLTRLLEQVGLNANVVDVLSETPCADAISRIEASVTSSTTTLASWGFSYRLPFTRALNQLAIQRRLPILFGACDGLVARVGPFVISGVTACLECCNSRLLAHAGQPEYTSFKRFQIQYQEKVPPPAPTHPLFHNAIAHLFAMELSFIAMKLSPQTAGGFIEYNVFDSCSRRHPIHRVPRCPGCHPVKPERLAWDARLSTSIVERQAR